MPTKMATHYPMHYHLLFQFIVSLSNDVKRLRYDVVCCLILRLFVSPHWNASNFLPPFMCRLLKMSWQERTLG
jgi:hypothetical protein